MRRGVREGACTGAATMPQPSTLRLILNAAALAAAIPTGCVCVFITAVPITKLFARVCVFITAVPITKLFVAIQPPCT